MTLVWSPAPSAASVACARYTLRCIFGALIPASSCARLPQARRELSPSGGGAKRSPYAHRVRRRLWLGGALEG